MSDKKYLLLATQAQIVPIRTCLRQMRYDVTLPEERMILDIAISEMVPMVRHGTLLWVRAMLVDRGCELDDAGNTNDADKWHRVSDMLFTVLRDINPNDD